jgi:hypothetical protein
LSTGEKRRWYDDASTRVVVPPSPVLRSVVSADRPDRGYLPLTVAN